MLERVRTTPHQDAGLSADDATETRGDEDVRLAEDSGLRARKKAQLHQRLRDCALDLFAQRGFDAVSVDDIADAAGASQRTFFRYFPTKQDVALDVLEELGAEIRRRLAEVAADVTPIDALRVVFVTLAETHPEWMQRELLVLRLAEDSPGLWGAMMLRRRGWEEEVAEVLAERDGGDAQRDPRYVLWAKIGFTISLANAEWTIARGDTDPVASLARAFDAAAATFGR